MANNYAGMSAEELKERAKEEQERRAALIELAKTDPNAVSAMSAKDRVEYYKGRDEERRAAEELRRQDRHAAVMDAHARRLEHIASAEAGRYNPQQQQSAIRWLESQGYGQEGERRRQFDVSQETQRKISENDMIGKIGYGKDAAAIQAEANKGISQNEWTARKEIAEQEAAARKYLGDTAAETQRYGIDAEHGKIGEDGSVTPGSRERAVKIQGESEVQKQKAANEGLAAQAEIARLNKEKDLAVQIKKAQIAANGKADSAKIASHAKIISAALSAGALQNKDAGTVLAELAEQYKNDPEMLSSIKSAGGGQQQQIPGYSPEKVAELQKRGYKWNGKQWVKPE